MHTRHGESQGTEQSSCIREMNDSSKEKTLARSVPIGDSPNSLQSDSLANTKASTELRRSSRAKFAPVNLVLSGGNSKTYGPPTATSTSSTIPVKSSAQKDLSPAPKFGNEETTRASNERNHLKRPEVDDDQKINSQELNKKDRASVLSSSHQPSMMVTRFKRSKSPSTAPEMVRTKRAKGVADLDEPTMIAFKEFLSHHKFDTLDEDELIGDMLSFLKAANEKTRTFLLELHSDEYGGDDESIFEKCLDVEETHAIGQEFLREIVAGISQTASAPAKKSNSTNFLVGDINKVAVDQKTVGWIRRATGLHRHTSNTELTQKYSSIRQEPQSSTSSRIATRRVVNGNGTVTKKRNRGLDVMADAIAELEKDFGTHFPVYRFRSSPPKKKKSRGFDESSTKIRKKKDGKQISARKRIKHHKVKMPSPRICTALRLLHEAWRFQSRPKRLIKHATETESEYLSRRAIPLHPQFVQAGIVHRLPKTISFLKNQETDVFTNSIFPLPNPSPTDKETQDAHFDVLTCLEGPPAKFAKYEFFYSDLDIEWYRENVIASALGLPLDAPLSHSEWKSIRRRCKLVPRRFSKQFIASELMERNKYRKTVRSIQSNPQMCPSEFQYNVYKPIPAGTMVKAYCKMHQTVQSGIVVSYDQKHAIYLIEFKDESYEYCPDSDVASSGASCVLIHKSAYSCQDERDIVSGQLRDTQLRFPATIQHMELMLEKSMVGLSKIFAPHNSSLSATSKKLLEDAANHDAFLTLMEVIDTAGMRMSDNLSLIADANTLAIDFLPFGEDNDHIEQPDPILSETTQEYLQWLHDNLRRTSQILSLAADYFQTLYGDY